MSYTPIGQKEDVIDLDIENMFSVQTNYHAREGVFQ